MSGLIQLSDETRGVLLDAYPTSAQPRRVTRSELPRTARAARDLLWTSHREELGYCAAATAYLMEFDEALYEGLGYSAIEHTPYKEQANLRVASPGATALERLGVKTARGYCSLAFELRPSLANRIRLGVIAEKGHLLGDQGDWVSAYSGVKTPEAFIAITAQDAGILSARTGRLEASSKSYLYAYENHGSPGDLVLAALFKHLGGGSTDSGEELARACHGVLSRPEDLQGIQSVLRMMPSAANQLLKRTAKPTGELAEVFQSVSAEQ